MIGGITDRDVVQAINRWTPAKAYDHERKFQSELQDYLDETLNNGGGVFGGSGGGVEVSTERGRSNADLAIDDRIGVELKRNLSNSQTDRLRGQIEKQRDEYEALIVVACGIDDMNGWRRVQNQVGSDLAGLDSPVHFIHKPRDEYGTGNRDDGGQGGLFNL